jgi:Domain of unknown function (DUF1918)
MAPATQLVRRSKIVQAEVGDKVTVTGQRSGDELRNGEIIKIEGENGSPPYLVRWQDGTESVVFLRDRTPGSGSQLVSRARISDEEGPAR